MFVRVRVSVFLAATAVVAMASAGAAFAAFSVSSAPAGVAQAPQPALAPVTVADPSDIYVPITPCRIVDTRESGAGGKFAANETRTYRVGGTSGFPGQGGKSGGCGIPLNATAIAANLTANAPVGNGYVRAWPSAIATEPAATVLTYVTGPGGISGATLSITPGVATSLKVRNHTGTTHLTIDVTGYYIQPIHARVTNAGALDWATNRVTSSSKLADGIFQVNVDRDLTGCSATASAHGGSPLFTSTAVTGSAVIVYVWTTGGASTNAYFYLDVSC